MGATPASHDKAMSQCSPNTQDPCAACTPGPLARREVVGPSTITASVLLDTFRGLSPTRQVDVIRALAMNAPALAARLVLAVLPMRCQCPDSCASVCQWAVRSGRITGHGAVRQILAVDFSLSVTLAAMLDG